MPDQPAAMPDRMRLLKAVDATWPAAGTRETDGWLLRRGGDGGKRVSAASALVPGDVPEIDAAIVGLADWGQAPLFRIGPGEAALDGALAGRGFHVIDPVALYCGRAAAIDDGRDHTARVILVGTPLRIVDEIWAEGGIGPGRRAVMERVAGPKTVLLARVEDRPAGVAFVAVAGDVAMIHAIEVAPAFRRKGAGRLLLQGAARFGCANGADWLALAVTEANEPARALYEGLGMAVMGHYHYRTRD